MLISLLVVAVHLLPALEEQSQTQAACAPCENDEDAQGPWTANLGVSAAWYTGNSDLFAILGNGVAEYTTAHWLVTLQADVAFERASVEGDGAREVIAESFGGFGRGEYRVTRMWSLYGLLGADTDHLASLELGVDTEVGVGLTLFERQRNEDEYLFLEFHLGWHYSRDLRFQYFPQRRELNNLNLWGPAGNITFRYQLTNRLQIREYLNLIPNVVGDARWLFDSKTVLAAALTDRLAATMYFTVDTDTAPPPDVKETDTSLTFGLEFVL